MTAPPDPSQISSVCPCCGSTEWKHKRYTQELWYHECASCRYWQQRRVANLQLREVFLQEQEKFYSDGSLVASDSFGMLNEELTQRRIRLIEKHVPRAGEIIEAGSGSGDVLLALAAKGYRCTAVEHSVMLADRLMRLGIERVLNGDFSEQALAPEAYDAYCSFHVIEHVVDFRQHIKAVHHCVKPGGLLILATPNAAGLEQNLPFDLQLNSDSAHFQLFSPMSLRLILRDAGFEVIEETTPTYALAWLRVVTLIFRRLKSRSVQTVGGAYARKVGPKLALGLRLFSWLSRPLRSVQERSGSGNELLVVARKAA
jgi:2-polyprenyl-3-methyl-5-hydroxy-6-metoxy-1,4-benzoquinol methylase